MTDNQNCYSHPDQAVRHSYPLAVKEDGFSVAWGLCLKTSPLIMIRLGVLLGLLFVAIVWLALCGGIASLFGGDGGMILFLIGFGLPAGLFFWLRQYVMYLLKMAHVAVITKLITEGSLPEGINQVQYGKELVTQKFGQTNVMFVLDSLITGVVRAFNSTLDWIADMLPIPGMENIMKVVNTIVNNATTYIDETIFSYNLARNDENVWRSSADGLVYYGQNAKPVLKTAVVSLVLEYVFSFFIFLACLVPALLIAKILPSSVSGFAWIVAIILAYIVRDAVLHPLSLTMVALTFHKNSFNQAINEDVARVMTEVSSKFEELCEKAKTWGSSEAEALKGGVAGGALPENS